MRLVKKLQNLGYALTGLRIAFREELSFKIQLVFAVVTPALGWYLGISRMEFLLVIFMIGLVLTAELFNTALEQLCDKFKSEHDPHIGRIKDLAAGAVLVASFTALIVGSIIFLPYVLALTLWNS